MSLLPKNVTVVDHPLIAHKLSIMRDKETSSANFRRLAREIALLLGYEVLRDLPTETRRIETPVGEMDAPFIKGKKLVFLPILRAGLGLVEGLLDLVPSARVGHIGIYREPETLTAVEYFLKVPEDITDRQVIVVDPLLATANSAIAALSRVSEMGVKDMKLVSLLSAAQGLEAVAAAFPDVPIYTAAVDKVLNEDGYIIPGLGDAGDRMFGTK
jgi:uracil phosphoribosyltransferase